VAQPGDEITIVVTGDIACDPEASDFNDGLGSEDRCRQKQVADLVGQTVPDAVLPLGDLQYEDGTLVKFNESYDLSWGEYREITYPVVGNHEYLTVDAAGYYSYFGSRAGDPDKGYYSYDLGEWHLVALNSNCSKIGGCKADSPQGQWLEADLSANKKRCTLAYWHHPRFSSGQHGSDEDYTDFWDILYKAGADVVLSGHDHNYERFAPQDAQGQLDTKRGIRQFVVGTGGKSIRNMEDMKPNSETHNSDVFGVLKLSLHASGYAWEFLSESGELVDKGNTDCHN
jgi:3',5'-cyclic AMP phosphodiesterase CpdA